MFVSDMSTENYLSGNISDIKIASFALSPEAIKTLYSWSSGKRCEEKQITFTISNISIAIAVIALTISFILNIIAFCAG